MDFKGRLLIARLLQEAANYLLEQEELSVTAMSRGLLVVDENVEELAGPLKDYGITVRQPPPGMLDDAIKKILLPERIIVTNNTADFIEEAPAFGYSIISVPQSLLADTQRAAKFISRAIIHHSVWSLQSKKVIFHMSLNVEGKSTLTILRG